MLSTFIVLNVTSLQYTVVILLPVPWRMNKKASICKYIQKDLTKNTKKLSLKPHSVPMCLDNNKNKIKEALVFIFRYFV